MSPNCSFLEFLAYIPEKSSKFGIFSSQNETEIMFFWGPIGIFGLISSVWDVFNRIQSYLEPGNLKSSFFGNFKFEANFAHFLASKNDYSHKSAIFSWKKPKWSKKDENMYKVYRKYKKNGFQNTLKMAKMCSLWGTVQHSINIGAQHLAIYVTISFRFLSEPVFYLVGLSRSNLAKLNFVQGINKGRRSSCRSWTVSKHQEFQDAPRQEQNSKVKAQKHVYYFW